MKIALTGHRPNKLGYEYDMDGPISNNIKNALISILNHEKATEIITGMALGADQIFATVGLHLSSITKVIAAIPFEGQECKWPQKSQDVYFSLLSDPKVEKYYVSLPGYSPEKMHARNRWMVNNCDKLIAVWDGSSGGTSSCVNYALGRNKEILYINPNEFHG